MTITRTPQVLTAAATLCLGAILFVGLGGLQLLVRASSCPLEFVGHLIGNVHHISLDRLDPTCPQCF